MRPVSDITLEVVNSEKNKGFMNYGLCDDLRAGLSIYKKLKTIINKRNLKGILNHLRSRK